MRQSLRLFFRRNGGRKVASTESAAGWNGDRLISIDRTADRDGDLILAAHSDQVIEPLMARPKGSACEIRIQRKGSQFRVALKDENAKDWNDLGAIDANMSPKVLLWITAYATVGDARAVVSRVEVEQPAK